MSETAEQIAAKSPIVRTVDQAAHGIHEAINTAAHAAGPMVDQIAAGAHQATDKLSGAAIHAAESITQKTRQTRDAEARFAESCRVQVREHPIASLGIAMAAGFALNWWLRRNGNAQQNQ